MGQEPTISDATNELNELFERFDGRLVSQSTAAVLLGLSPQTVYTLCSNGTLRLLKGPEWDTGVGVATSEVESVTRWRLVPLSDVAAYAQRVGRLTPQLAIFLPEKSA